MTRWAVGLQAAVEAEFNAGGKRDVKVDWPLVHIHRCRRGHVIFVEEVLPAEQRHEKVPAVRSIV